MVATDALSRALTASYDSPKYKSNQRNQAALLSVTQVLLVKR